MRDEIAFMFSPLRYRGMGRVLKAKSFQSEKTVRLARSLIGKLLVRREPGAQPTRHLIIETEAYDGEHDLACHASKGRTTRTEVMYQSGGRWYVYLCYGVHEMLNLVTGPSGYPAAILIRGIATVSGPGRLTKRLRITRTLNNAPAIPASGLHVEDDGIELPRGSIKSGPRVGVDYAGAHWAAKHWRFWLVPGKVAIGSMTKNGKRPSANR